MSPELSPVDRSTRSPVEKNTRSPKAEEVGCDPCQFSSRVATGKNLETGSVRTEEGQTFLHGSLRTRELERGSAGRASEAIDYQWL